MESASEPEKVKVKHLGHCFRNSRTAGIEGAKGLDTSQIEEDLAHAKAQRKLLQKEAPALRTIEIRTKHLQAIADGKGVKAKQILRKIHAEESKKIWFQIRRAMKAPQGRATMMVQKMTTSGLVKESTTQEETEEMIFGERKYRFQLSMNAPILSTDLIEKLGNFADTKIAQQIIEGIFDTPDEIDEATAEILDEIGSIGIQLTNSSISINIIPEEFRQYWKRA